MANLPSLDVQIQNHQSPQGPLNFVAGEGLLLARLSFLSRLGTRRIKRDLILGSVYGSTGSRLIDWVTCMGRHRVFIRGAENVVYRKCPICKRDQYWADGPHYLYPKPPQGPAILESSDFGLVMPEKTWKQLRLGRVPGIRIERLPVFDKSLDGLPALTF
jgi:hypothetical protein